jgi:catechol-2,3-dioxygenase
MGITRLNHAVFYVRNVSVTKRFYSEVLGFTTVIEDPAGRFLFMRAGASRNHRDPNHRDPNHHDPNHHDPNHHDIAFFAVGERALANTAGRVGAMGNVHVGLYHVAWQVESIAELEHMRRKLIDAGALTGSSDHGVSKSLYAVDPDGAEFEIMWPVPASLWGDMEHDAIIEPLDLPREIDRYSEIVE